MGEGEGKNATASEDADIAELQKQVAAMEEEAEELSKKSAEVETEISAVTEAVDENSIYVGQVDYEATVDDLRAHFAPCGTINRITIKTDKITGYPKGFGYIEFVDKDSVEKALKLDDTPFKGRQLKVLPKRKETAPSFRGGRGGYGRGGGRGGRGGFYGRGGGPPFRGGRGGFRGGGGGRRGGYGGRGRGGYGHSYY